MPGTLDFFGFPDLLLSRRVRNAFHAMGLNENRKDFDITRWVKDHDTPSPPGQVVKQVWFAGSHADIGGGWVDGDLSMITLMWMASNVVVHTSLSMDLDFLLNLPRPVAGYGHQTPHNPITQGNSISVLEAPWVRQINLQGESDGGYQEHLHPSVLEQDTSNWPPILAQAVEEARKDPTIVCKLYDAEEKLKAKWNTYPKGEALPDTASGSKAVQTKAWLHDIIFIADPKNFRMREHD